MLVIGIGNELRGDDAAGLLVARQIRAQQPEIQVLESSADPMTLMEAWEGEQRVILVDAVESGSPPGEIHRHAAHEQALPADFFHCSTHSIGVAEAVEFARNLSRMPAELIVYGIEGADFQSGAEVHPAVSASVNTLTECIIKESL